MQETPCLQTTENDLRISTWDGFRAELVQNFDKYEINVQLSLGGEGAGAGTVWSRHIDECSAGEAQRNLQLVEAICRHLNAGGDYGSAVDMVKSLSELFRGLTVSLPDGWELAACSYEVPDPTVVFVNYELDKSLVWKHKIYSETMSLEDLYEHMHIS